MGGPFDQAAKEHEFQTAQAAFLSPPRVQQKTVTLIITVAAYAAISLGTNASHSWSRLVILVGVLLVHELGHAAGMLAFGYTDVRIFFIPLLGAAAAGRRRGVARWKHGVVLLLGPLPGLVAGVVMLVAGVTGTVHTVALMLVVVNGFNLIPVAPFDGGQLFQLLVFSRHRHLELAFLVAAGLALIAGAFALESYIFGVVGYVVLVTVPIRMRLLAAAARLRELGLPSDPLALDEDQRRDLFDRLWQWMPRQWHGRPRSQAAAMESMLEAATQQPVSGSVTTGLLAGWLGAAALAVAGVIVLRLPPAHWQIYHHRDPAFTVELPGEPEWRARPGGGAVIVLQDKRAFGVVWETDAPGSEIRDVRTEDQNRGLHRRRRMVTTADHLLFTVNAISPDDAEAERVLGSFHAGDAPP